MLSNVAIFVASNVLIFWYFSGRGEFQLDDGLNIARVFGAQIVYGGCALLVQVFGNLLYLFR